MSPRAETWGLWSWAEKQKVWMEVGRGTEKDMTAALERRRAAAAKHLPSARFAATPLSQPPDWVPDSEPAPEKGYLPRLSQETSDAIADAIIEVLGSLGQSAVVTVGAAQVDPGSDADGAALVSVIWSAKPPEERPRRKSVPPSSRAGGGHLVDIEEFPIGNSDTGTKGYGGTELAPGRGGIDPDPS